MTAKNYLLRLPVWTGMLVCVSSALSCMTTYDAHGRPVQSVDPGAAAAGVVAAGVVGYAIGNRRDRDRHHYHGGYYGRGYR